MQNDVGGGVLLADEEVGGDGGVGEKKKTVPRVYANACAIFFVSFLFLFRRH